MMGISLNLDTAGNITTVGVNDEAKEFGFQEGDIILKVMGNELNLRNAQQTFAKIGTMKVGDPYELVVRRGETEVTIKAKLVQRMKRHVFEEMKNLTDRQEFLRERWMKTM